jgi:uncharacterized protein YjbI with pentapeptide repeats
LIRRLGSNAEDNIRKTTGQLLGGAAVLIGAGFAYMQFTQQQQTSRELLISNQVGKGFEQLGSDKVVVRLGGIYALEGVMNSSEQYHQPVLEALGAFVRDGTRTDTGDGPPATDVQAALTVIGRRNATAYNNDPELAHVLIPKAQLGHANLIRANLSGGANLSGADLIGADLSAANLSGADLSAADGMNADLSRANLNRAKVKYGRWHNVILRGTNLAGAELQAVVLINADLTGANLRGANLSGPLRDVENLTGTTLNGANLSRVDLRDANLSRVDLRDANLSSADLRDANLNGADLRGASAKKLGQCEVAHTPPPPHKVTCCAAPG